jgi:hypothetical protein
MPLTASLERPRNNSTNAGRAANHRVLTDGKCATCGKRMPLSGVVDRGSWCSTECCKRAHGVSASSPSISWEEPVPELDVTHVTAPLPDRAASTRQWSSA